MENNRLNDSAEVEVSEETLESELLADFEASFDKKYDGERVYDITVDGVPIQVDACSMVLAGERVKQYIRMILKESQSQTGSNRAFWSDILMLNVLTTRIIAKSNPYVIERILNPVKYHTMESARKYYENEQMLMELSRQKEQEQVKEEDNR